MACMYSCFMHSRDLNGHTSGQFAAVMERGCEVALSFIQLEVGCVLAVSWYTHFISIGDAADLATGFHSPQHPHAGNSSASRCSLTCFSAFPQRNGPSTQSLVAGALPWPDVPCASFPWWAGDLRFWSICLAPLGGVVCISHPYQQQQGCFCFFSSGTCESRGGRAGLPVPNTLCGLCGRKATLNFPSLSSGQALRRVSRWTSVPFARRSPFSSQPVVYGHRLLTLALTINPTLELLSPPPIM